MFRVRAGAKARGYVSVRLGLGLGLGLGLWLGFQLMLVQSKGKQQTDCPYNRVGKLILEFILPGKRTASGKKKKVFIDSYYS